jgi:hypothetical protein
MENARLKKLKEYMRQENYRWYFERHGKTLTWTVREREGIKSGFYEALDVDRAGFVSIEAIENVLLSVGLVDSRGALWSLAVYNGITSVGLTKKSNLLDFDEFLVLIKAVLADQQHRGPIVRKLKDIMTGTNTKYIGMKFPSIAKAYKRHAVIDAVIHPSPFNTRILKSYEVDIIRDQNDIAGELREKRILIKISDRHS